MTIVIHSITRVDVLEIHDIWRRTQMGIQVRYLSDFAQTISCDFTLLRDSVGTGRG